MLTGPACLLLPCQDTCAAHGSESRLPRSLPAQNCEAVIYKNVNTTGRIPANSIFSTGTAGKGTGCQLIVTSQQGGTVLIVNSANQVLYGEHAALPCRWTAKC